MAERTARAHHSRVASRRCGRRPAASGRKETRRPAASHLQTAAAPYEGQHWHLKTISPIHNESSSIQIILKLDIGKGFVLLQSFNCVEHFELHFL